MGKELPAAERPLAGQVAAMTLLVGAAWLPLAPYLDAQISVYIALLLGLRTASLRRHLLAPGRWLLLPLTLAGMANVFSSYQTFVGQKGGTALLGTMLALKVLEIRRLRDLRVGTILFGFLLVTQFLFNQSALLALYLALLLVLNVALMADSCSRSGEGRQALFAALRTAARLSLQALPLALVLFVLFPRLSAPLWSLGPVEEQARSGVNDWLEPGSVSELVIDGRPAFRARFEGPVPPENARYWRGPVVWHTDGRRWTAWPPGVPRGKVQELVEAEEKVAYRIELEPGSKRWLFALDMPVETPGDARVVSDFQVLSSRPVKENRSYRMVSALRYNTGGLNLEQELAGTQLPGNLTPRMRALVTDWKEASNGPQEIVAQALRFFREQPFHYTLLPPKLGPNPTDEFLFETRRGFCEHYASSFALLMRIAGIPARIVLGYLGGEYNALGGYLIVRQSDAHAWVEVWLEGKGWVRVDPTGAVAPGRVERSDLLDELASGAPMRFRLDDVDALRRWAHNLRLLGDAMETGWRDWVLGLSSERQQRMMETVGLGTLREYGLAIALIMSAAIVVGLLLAAMTRPIAPRDPLERMYATFCKRLSRVGLSRKENEGPQDYSRRVIAKRPDLRATVESFADLYLAQRYGAIDRPEDRRKLGEYLRRFRPRRHKRL